MAEVQGNESAQKKPYNTPVLQVYGDLKVITQGFDPGKGGAEVSNDMHFNSAP